MKALIARKPVTHPLKPRRRLRDERRAGGKVRKPPDTCPLSNMIISHNNILVLLFLPSLSISQQVDKVRLVGHMGLQANRYHTLNATAVSHRTRGPPAARPDLVSDLRWEVVKIFTGVALSAHMLCLIPCLTSPIYYFILPHLCHLLPARYLRFIFLTSKEMVCAVFGLCAGQVSQLNLKGS